MCVMWPKYITVWTLVRYYLAGSTLSWWQLSWLWLFSCLRKELKGNWWQSWCSAIIAPYNKPWYTRYSPVYSAQQQQLSDRNENHTSQGFSSSSPLDLPPCSQSPPPPWRRGSPSCCLSTCRTWWHSPPPTWAGTCQKSGPWTEKCKVCVYQFFVVQIQNLFVRKL